MFKISRIALFTLAAAFATGASAAGPTGGASDFGSAVTNAAGERVIQITPATRYVHVTNGESVTFEVDGKRFSWHVDTYSNVFEFALDRVAPQGVAVPAVRVMVAPNPLYRG